MAWNRRFGNTFQFGVSYTLSKSMDNGSNQRDVVQDTYDTSILWGPSEFDARQIAIINYLYQLPFFRTQKGFAGKAFGGWQMSGITQFQTGLPCSVIAPNVGYAAVGQDADWGYNMNCPYIDSKWRSQDHRHVWPEGPVVRHHQSRRDADFHSPHAWNFQDAARS